jgi:DNA-binding PadR family transcriptional regulator
MTAKQELILLYIYTDFARNQYSLVKYLDQIEFPAQLNENLKILIEKELIIVSGLLHNRTEFEYSITEKGREYIKSSFRDTEVENYVSSKTNADSINEITKALLEKKNGL